MRVTINDVARAAGVTVATASRARPTPSLSVGR
ncbi:MAG TPA: LacI family DNA-binding transcriptional regulator [Chloroflexota bacterium]|nr:LacI family DNA-binding transcriptional regulator [Chloroflexota bacterium]